MIYYGSLTLQIKQFCIRKNISLYGLSDSYQGNKTGKVN